MNKYVIKCHSICLAAILMASITPIFSQGLSDIDKLLQAGKEDANTLMGPYIDPFMKAFGFGFVNGWYNTAKPHKPLGFDLTVSGTLVFVPDEALNFNVNDLDLKEINLLNPSDGEIPTVFGNDDTTPIFEFNTIPGLTFNGPSGENLEEQLGGNYVLVPMAQLGIGLIKGTDIKVRYLPEIDVADVFNIKFFGIGILHGIKQYIPLLKESPLEMAIFAGYTDITSTINLSGAFNDAGNNDQEAIIDIKGLTYQFLISYKISILTFYLGIGGNMIKSDFKLNGTYEIDPTLTLIDPVDLSFESGGIRGTAGLTLSLGVLNLFADYNLQEYKSATAGIGIRFR